MKTSICLAAALAAAGCGGLTPPNLCHPGTAAVQRQRAERFDPYPDPSAGPAIDGGRPRDYEKPLPDPERYPRK